MATRSTIAVVNSDGSVSQIYCHYDGYVSHNGRILKEEYNNLAAATELVSHGDMSFLAENINPTHPDHSFDSAQEGVCVYNGRDRGEENTEPSTYWNLEMYFMTMQSEEYDYLFKDNEWFLVGGGGKLTPFDYKKD